MPRRAVTDVAARCDIRCERPRLLQGSNNVVWHLEPAPVVAKVAGSGHRPGSASLLRELEVGRFLATRDAPTVRPTSTPPPGPYRACGTVVTLWEYCVHEAVEVDAGSAALALAQVHDVLADYAAALPRFTEQIEDAGRLLAGGRLPALAVEDQAFLTAAHRNLSAALASRHLILRPLHGEAHLGNVMATHEGPRWHDFEAACIGPVKWDLAALDQHALDPAADVDRDLLQLMGRLRSLCVAAWCWLNPDRAPELREAAEHHLQRLKDHG